MVKPIVSYGTPVLTRACEPATSSLVVADLIDTLRTTSGGVGLAAPQIGVSEQVFIIKTMFAERVFINPVITKRRHEQKSDEGCLSIPSIYGKLTRASIIDVEYYDVLMNKQKTRLRGFESIVFQHEYDHLAGILFIDYFDKEGLDKIKDRLAEIEAGKIETKYLMSFPSNVQLLDNQQSTSETILSK